MQHFKTKQLALAAMFTAITAAAAQILVPLGFTPVPFTLSLVAVYLTGALLNKKCALLSLVVYVLLGTAGAPIFAGFAGGLHKIAGPTGGYIIAYPLMAVVIAYLREKWGSGFWKYCISMLIALVLCYTIGTIQLLFITKADLLNGLMMAVFPFIPLDLVKIALSAWLAVLLDKALMHAHISLHD
ncbi:biotin transporter BioY [Oscillospiraceae bacterium PP1C4]